MREFFRGWKRKVGVLTLLMACVLMAGWMRSNYMQDLVTLPRKPAFLQLSSYRNTLSWYELHGVNDDEFDFTKLQIGWSVREVFKGPAYYVQIIPFQTTWSWCGFFFGDGIDTHDASRRQRFLRIPYWSIVIFLTAISAFLLLTKPFKSTQKKITDPTANEGATS